MVKVRASQIFTHSADDAVAAKKLLDSGATFTEVVDKYSTCPSKQNGGDLGWMPEENATSLIGEVSSSDQGKILGPVHSPYGYHILMITEIEEENEQTVFHPDTRMTEVNKVFPEIHTFLFKNFHIGMPVSRYESEETIFSVCEKHGKKIGEILAAINSEVASKLSPTISPDDLNKLIQSKDPNLVLLDIREQWEHDIAQIVTATLINRDNFESVVSALSPEKDIVIIDWKGDRSPSFQKFLSQKGLKNTRGLQGGIDAWAESVDTKMARYDIDEEDDDYRYEDILGNE